MGAFSTGYSAGFDSATSPASGDPLLGVPIELLRQRVGLASTDGSKDAEITAAFLAAIDAMESYCDRFFSYASRVETETHFEGAAIALRGYPIDTVAVVISDDGIEPPFHVQKKTGVVKLDMHARFHELNISYTGGYTVLPPTLQIVALTTFDAAWASINSSGGSSSIGKEVKATTMDGMRVEYFDPNASSASSSAEFGFIPASMLPMLAPYNRRFA